jgi:hypothetical protein
MKSDSGGDGVLLYWFILITVGLWVSLFLVLRYFGYSISDIPSNGNVILPIITTTLSFLSSVIGTLSFIPYVGTFATALSSFITSLSSFFNIWNVLNIYLFYVIFIPWSTTFVFIILRLVMPDVA